MAAIKPRKMIRTLTSKLGFLEDDTHHHRYFLELDGRKHVRTRVSHSLKTDIGDDLLVAMARQMSVTHSELLDMVRCTKDADWYYSKLRAMH